MLLIDFLLRLKIDLNTWCISVEKEAGEINPPPACSTYASSNMHTLDRLKIPPLAALHPGMPIPSPVTNQASRSGIEQSARKPRATRGGRSRWTPTSELLLTPVIGLMTYIESCLGDGETFPALDNISIMCLPWSLCGSCSID